MDESPSVMVDGVRPKSGCAAHDDPCANACEDRHQAAPAKMSTLEVEDERKRGRPRLRRKRRRKTK